MKKEIYINESMGETRIAIVEDSQLVEVYIEKQDKQIAVEKPQEQENPVQNNGEEDINNNNE